MVSAGHRRNRAALRTGGSQVIDGCEAAIGVTRVLNGSHGLIRRSEHDCEVRRRVDPAGEEQTVAIIRCPGDRYPSEPLGQLHSTGEIRKEANARSVRKDRKSTRLNSSHVSISYAVFCLKKKRNYR